MVPMALWVGQHWFEAVDTGSNPSLHLHFKLLRRKILILPPSSPPLIFKLFRSWKSSETQHTRVPLRNFSVLRDKNFSIENRDFPLLGIKFFDTRNFLKGSSTKCFDTVRSNIFGGKSWYPPPLLSPTFFDTRIFLKHRRAPLRNVLILWDKTLLTENRDTRRLSYPQQFSIPEIFWNTEGFLFEVFRHYETKIFQRKIVIPFSRNYRN